jgi:photosystem II stability/assembly factor-like uncharacterized protein
MPGTYYLVIMKKANILLFLLMILQYSAICQTMTIELLASGTKTNLRGLSVVNANVLWVSGSNGMVGRSTNAGKNWKWMTVKGFEKSDFRDIEALGVNTAIIMAISEPAYLLRTTDGGDTWKIVYENKQKGMFLDAMDFSSPTDGIVVGDPINNKIFLATTKDAGTSWQQLDADGDRLKADSGEAFFAASGSNIRMFGNGHYFLVSGGTRSRLFTNKKVIDLPLIQGKETTGANAVAVYERGNLFGSKKIIVVGGDFAADSSITKNCFYSTNSGKKWKSPKRPPNGYRSSVEYISSKYVVTCGLNGVDLSENGGRTWQVLSREAYNTCRLSRMGNAVYLAGPNGKIGRLFIK